MRRRSQSLFKPAEIIHKATSAMITQKDYFFVDTNVILAFRLNRGNNKLIDDFIRYPGHQFFYTETVMSELQAGKRSPVPESDPKSNTDQFFNYRDSKIDFLKKEQSIDFFHQLWLEKFHTESNRRIKGFELTVDQLTKFKNDLLIIMESGYVCHAPGVLPDDDFRTPTLLTSNMRLLKKFIVKPESREVLENTINLLGLEHLMPVSLLEETMKAWDENIAPSPKVYSP